MEFPFDLSLAEWLICDKTTNSYCVVFRNVIPIEFCDQLYNDCSLNCTKQHSVSFGGVDVLQHRLTCAFSDDDVTEHSYSGSSIKTIPWTPSIKILRDTVKLKHFVPNSCLVNGYITPDHNVGWHSDKNLCDPLKTVITVSICGSRRFSFREKANHSNKITTYLNNGDVVYFFGNTNLLYEHSILKCLKGDVDSRPRYSLTFRILEKSI